MTEQITKDKAPRERINIRKPIVIRVFKMEKLKERALELEKRRTDFSS